MLKILKQQVLERLSIMPDVLKDALISDINADLVWQIGLSNHLTEDKIVVIATITGDVIMGFLHSDDVAKQIRESLDINPEIANSIAHEISRKIFAPIRLELENNYNPITELAKIKPVATPGTTEEKFVSAKAVEPEIKPKPIEITGMPKPAPAPTPATPAPKIEPRIAPKPISAEQPFIIHQETETKSFTEKKKTTMPTMGWFRKESSKTPESPIKVELETFGQKTEVKKEPVIAKTEAPKQRIIHYREVEVPAPFGKTPASAEASAGRQGKPEGQTPKEIPPQKIETPILKPEPPKPITQTIPTAPAAKPEPSAKLTEPAIINLDSFGVIRENKTPNEVKLEGNTINLKNNKE